MKKLLIALVVAAILSVVFAVPVSADQPDNPGSFGEQQSLTAQHFQGLSEWTQDIFRIAESMELAPGGVINWILEVHHGMPPAHTP